MSTKTIFQLPLKTSLSIQLSIFDLVKANLALPLKSFQFLLFAIYLNTLRFLIDTSYNYAISLAKLRRAKIMNNVHFSSKTNEWYTPLDLFRQLDRKFNFTLDPCCTHQNAKCEKHYTKEDDGLSKSWAGETVFMNPPYGREIGLWVKKAYEESRNGATVVCLIPARTDTQYWHEYVMKADEIWLKRGRVKFGGSPNSAPFPSAVVVFRPDSNRCLLRAF